MDFFWVIVIATSIWVLIDAKTIGVKKGQIQGMGNLGPWGWFFACLLLWIIGFPFYLAKRSEFKRINSGASQERQGIVAGTTQTKKGISVIGWIGIVFFGGIALLALFGQRDDGMSGGGSSSTSTATSSTSTYSVPEPQTPLLEIQSWRCDKEHGYVFVRGEVKNISSLKLENVVAVGEFRTKGGDLVKSEDALLDYNPIMPGQTSPFSAGGTDNPQISDCQLGFKYLFGGVLAYVEKKKGK